MPYAPANDSSFLTRRGFVFILIVGLHLGMYYVLNSGLSEHLVDVVLGPIETRMIEEAPKTDEPPPPPPPDNDAAPPVVPPPEEASGLPVESPASTANATLTNERPTAPRPPDQHAAPLPRAAPKTHTRRHRTQPEYPPSSRRAGEAGTVILEVYVLETGRVGEAKVKQSSGFPRLDEAAVREVKRSWRLVPGTENGKPVPMWGQFAVTFKLTD